ncbi:MAG: hypothetical protein SCK70_07610 [bacterium]|nr:hypothetical protein [bacterium]
MFHHIDKLKHEPPVEAQVRIERGCPRLFLNGCEIFPLFAWSWGLEQSASLFREAGVQVLHPILGLNSIWSSPEVYDWTSFDQLFDRLLEEHPSALFLPRLLLDAPEWWKRLNRDELVECAIPVDTETKARYHTARINPEGGWYWGLPLEAPSLASEKWIHDMEKILIGLLKHVEQSPLRSRVIGFQIGSGIYGEWHYFLAEFLPDRNRAVERKIGAVPDASERIQTRFGLLRDPQYEKQVIEFYERFHNEVIADAAMIVATSDGERTLRLPKSMQDVDSGVSDSVHRLTMKFGQVKIFLVES